MGHSVRGHERNQELKYPLVFLFIFLSAFLATEKAYSAVAQQSIAETAVTAMFSMYGVFISIDILSFFVNVYWGSRGKVITIRGREKWVSGATAFYVIILVVVLYVAISEVMSFTLQPTIVAFVATLGRFIIPTLLIVVIPISPVASLYLRGNLRILSKISSQLLCFHLATISGSCLAAVLPIAI